MNPRLARVVAGSVAPGVRQLVTPVLGATVVASLRAAGLVPWWLDTAGAHDKATALDAFAAAFSLPAWFGRNWDALVDAWRDVPFVPPAPVVVWTGAADLVGRDADAFATAYEIVAEGAQARGVVVVIVTPSALAGVPLL